MVTPKARLIVLVLAGAAAVLGQRVISAKAGFVSFVQGRASVEGGLLKIGEAFRQLKEGERLSTERGRAEVLLNPGTMLRLGDMSRLRMDDVKITDACVSLESGSAVVTVNYLLKTDHFRVISGDSVIVIKQAGVYRLDVGRLDVGRLNKTPSRLRVFSGQVEVQRDGFPAKKVIVKRGHAVDLDDGLKIVRFDVKETDAFQKWVIARSFRRLVPRGLRSQPPRIGWGGTSDQPTEPSSPGGASTSSKQF